MRSALVALAALVSATAAFDLRELYTFSGESSADFCAAWNDACTNYKPSDTSLFFLDTACRPGDFQGQHTDTEALASCAFTQDGHVPISENDAIASEVGGTLV
ncbi:hypothetical protein BC834DRAFT_820702 [Gloeopeniophorella convolvens]|nr:hypothetical protein BC834DRAFT_820702 [Gloeopeniophorella convolvens]